MAAPDIPSRRPRRDGLRLLTAAVAGGSVVAGHALVGLTGTHVEDVALQAFTAPVSDTDRGAEAGPSQVDVLAAAPTPGPGVEALAGNPPVDVSGRGGAATTGAREAARGREARSGDAATAPPTPGENGGGTCAAGTDGFGSVADGVAAAGEQLRCMFAIDTVYGVAGRSNASDHPAGKALDFMADRAAGDRLAEYAAANMDELGISYVIYRQRINTGDGWESMEDRGGTTANHMDHVHVSFD